ncbi:MAG: efflux RND transporter permease subunit [Bacteroidetes bacterium]|nr:MAG: efflux RND transporter permease subunit [Bacteroidota bacterium]
MNFKEFGMTSWSIDNKTAIYILTIFITLFGVTTYNSLPKEQFPDIVIPTIYVSTIYPGTSPSDMENLVTRKIEKQIKAVSGVKKMNSNSVQDFSNIIVEFNPNIKVEIAKQRIKDAVDKAKMDLPKDLPQDPSVVEVNFSDIPVMQVNISGDYPDDKLKAFSEIAKEKIEGIRQVTRVDRIGDRDKELQIDVDMYKMQASTITFRDIEAAIKYENMTMSAGNIKLEEMKRSVRITGEFKDASKLAEQVGNIVVKSAFGSPVYLKDIAKINYTFTEQESYARMNHNPVISLAIVKRAGENLIETSDKVKAIMTELQKTKFPKDLEVVITGDFSTKTKTTLNDLINSIIIGFILVTIVLMFFMGVTNALFVGLSVPISMCLAFMVMPTIDFSLNMIVLFAFLFALGIVVDDAIVVIENTHRIYHQEHLPIDVAAKKAAGEVIIPVVAGTATTLAPFVPLMFWPGIVGKFMYFLPVTLIITLSASLFVAFIINPVFAVAFMRKEKVYAPGTSFREKNKGLLISLVVIVAIAILFYISGGIGMGNFLIFLGLLLIFNKFVLTGMIKGFQEKALPALMNTYEKVIYWSLRGRHKALLLGGTVVLLFLSIWLIIVRQPQVVFFPSADPNFVYVYVQLPNGTDQAVTDSVAKIVEGKVYGVIGENNPIVESVITNVTIGTNDPSEGDRSPRPNRARIGVSFVGFEKREGVSTQKYLDDIRAAIKGVAGADIVVDQEKGGPPTGKPIAIEITGDELEDLVDISKSVKRYVDSLAIPGIEELRSDLEDSKPEITIDIDRERANREGISTGQIGSEIRSAIFGLEVSKFRDGEDENKIMVRYAATQRNQIDELLNLKITFRDMAMGGIVRQIPLSSLAKIRYNNSYAAIKRKNQKRIVTIGSNVLSGYSPNDIVPKIDEALKSFPLKEGYDIKMGGELEDQKETSDFLGKALLISLGMIFGILATQFNSFSKPLIILSEIVFTIIGVLLGVGIFKMNFVIVMTGIGVVGLAGIVVKNGILLIEFMDELRARGLPLEKAIVEAGKTRMSPVLLTAASTILGLIPMAIGFNIDFVSLFQHFEPNIFLGGDNVAFWAPLSWTIIFGLGFATFITLILVPCMYHITESLKLKWKKPNTEISLEK